ncbi:GSCOCG00012616001-RA-CDS [Cotesia congregata]|nr:GSCOCG00012616001-RA-CDS [Cotesia congregata]
MEYLIDFTCYFMPNGSFTVKEFCITEITDEYQFNGVYECDYYLFKPPMTITGTSVIKQNLDYNGRRHGFSWDVGKTAYNVLGEILKNLTCYWCYLYVEGEQKKEWLEKLIDDPSVVIIYLTKMRHYSIDNIEFTRFKCPSAVHTSTGYLKACAFQNVQQLKLWYLKFYGCQPSYNKSVQLFNQLTTLRKMHPRDLACLDSHFLLHFAKREIRFIWDKLPKHLKHNEEIKEYSFCKQHYPITGADWETSGIYLYPYRKFCLQCNLEK